MDIQSVKVRKAGAYVQVKDKYLFALGTKLFQGRIPIFRLGGHLEANESAWQCAAREVKEEAAITLTPAPSSYCYLTDGDDEALTLKKVQWEAPNDEKINPLLVVSYFRENTSSLSVMFLAKTNEFPKPYSEIKGLILLNEHDIHSLSHEKQTLEAFLENGGQAILKHNFDTKLELEPFTQLRLLSKILSLQKANL